MSTTPPPVPPASGFGYSDNGENRSFRQQTPRPNNLILATGRHRVAALFLEMALAVVTLGIGWMIWSLIVWGRGQTPAKQILKIRVYAANTLTPANWAHTAIYEFLFVISVSMVSGILNFISFGILGSVAYFAYWITDFCWYYKDRQCRTLRDHACKTLIINIA